VLVLVLVLDTQRLKSFEDEDETANELIETALILRSSFSDQTGRPRLAAAPTPDTRHPTPDT